jgi:xylulose-5-phosphate/fructose-6-phosphate phosphoketolase
MKTNTLTPELLNQMDAYWRAANYLSVGQIYLYDNPLLKRPLTLADVKHKLLGHWGTTSGQNFIYAHLNRVIKKYDLDMIYVSGPGHGGPAVVGNTYLEGTYSEIYPDISQDEAGLQKLFKQFSFPGGIPSHASPGCPGSIHEGGELGYSLSHAFGAVFDNPDLIVACVFGNGEAETAPLATAWQSNKFLNPITDGAVLPILHLNGYKISNPSVLARIEHELEQFLRGCGWTPHFVEGDESEWLDKNNLSWFYSPPRIKLLPVTDARKLYPLSWEAQTRLFKELPPHLPRMALFKVNTGTREKDVVTCAGNGKYPLPSWVPAYSSSRKTRWKTVKNVC